MSARLNPAGGAGGGPIPVRRWLVRAWIQGLGLDLGTDVRLPPPGAITSAINLRSYSARDAGLTITPVRDADDPLALEVVPSPLGAPLVGREARSVPFSLVRRARRWVRRRLGR